MDLSRCEPDLTRFADATPIEAALAQLFTAIKPTAVDGVPDAHNVWLVVGVQHFQLSGYCDTEEEASWVCWQLAKALHAVRQVR